MNATNQKYLTGPFSADFVPPDTYLHILEKQSGEEFIMVIEDDELLCIRGLISVWLEETSDGMLSIDGELCPSYCGHYYARIITDGNHPSTCCVWDSAGFFAKCEDY